MKYAIYGVGGFGREVTPLAKEDWLLRASADPDAPGEPDIVFVDDGVAAPESCNGYPVIDFQTLCSDEHRDRRIVVAVGDGKTRALIEMKCVEAGLKLGKIAAPTTRILDGNSIGSGSVLCDFVTVTSNAKIGKSFQANIYSYVAHDCVIGDYVTFAPRVSCNGNVHVGDFAYIGTGAMIVQGTSEKPLVIGEGAVVGMGAVVTKPVEPYTLVVGNPARAIKSLPRPDAKADHAEEENA